MSHSNQNSGLRRHFEVQKVSFITPSFHQHSMLLYHYCLVFLAWLKKNYQPCLKPCRQTNLKKTQEHNNWCYYIFMIHNLIFIVVQQSRYFISKIYSLFWFFTHHFLSSPQTSSTSFSIIIHKHWTFLYVPEKIVRINGEHLKTPTTTSARPSESVPRYFPLQPVTMD